MRNRNKYKNKIFVLLAGVLATLLSVNVVRQPLMAMTTIGIIDTEPLKDSEEVAEENPLYDKYNNMYTSSESLFEENRSYVYNYCPSVIKEKNDYHIYYCANSEDNVIEDYIYYTNSVVDGENIYYSDGKIVLEPSENGWDSRHVCDPSVIEGNFMYKGTEYKYLMAYLGCSSSDNQNNKIGLAVSNEYDTGWEKVGSYPFINFSYDKKHSDSFQWGVGQASLLQYGEYTLVFYTKGTWNLTSTILEVWDLSNLDCPVQINKFTVSNKGTSDFISNADFAFIDDYLYMICDKHPFAGYQLNIVADASKIYRTPIQEGIHVLKNCVWEPVDELAEDNTGSSKNHNACLVRNPAGKWVNEVLYTSAVEKRSFLDSLWTYRINIYRKQSGDSNKYVYSKTYS